MEYVDSIKQLIREGIGIYQDRRDAVYVRYLLVGWKLDVRAVIPCLGLNLDVRVIRKNSAMLPVMFDPYYI
jgi:hypothetical protein